MFEPAVHELEERRFDPRRPVLVQGEGAGGCWQRAWRLRDDSRPWVAESTSTADHEWAPGDYSAIVLGDGSVHQAGPALP